MEIQATSSITASLLSSRTQAASRKEKTETTESGSENTEIQANTAKTAGARPAGPPPAGAPPAGLGPKPVNAPDNAGGSSSSSSSTAKVYDQRDYNQDGTVSNQETMRYELAQQANQTQKQGSSQSNQVQVGLAAYQQAQSANITGAISSKVLEI